MGYSGQNVIQHDFGFPRIIVRSGDAEIEALYAMLVSLGATKLMAQKLMKDYPESEARSCALPCARPGTDAATLVAVPAPRTSRPAMRESQRDRG